MEIRYIVIQRRVTFGDNWFRKPRLVLLGLHGR